MRTCNAKSLKKISKRFKFLKKTTLCCPSRVITLWRCVSSYTADVLRLKELFFPYGKIYKISPKGFCSLNNSVQKVAKQNVEKKPKNDVFSASI